ncbi:MAG: hypothetical protein AAGA56_26600 [Myxococcota bacterium]
MTLLPSRWRPALRILLGLSLLAGWGVGCGGDEGNFIDPRAIAKGEEEANPGGGVFVGEDAPEGTEDASAGGARFDTEVEVAMTGDNAYGLG